VFLRYAPRKRLELAFVLDFFVNFFHQGKKLVRSENLPLLSLPAMQTRSILLQSIFQKHLLYFLTAKSIQSRQGVT
jgi:hypothetical protein